MRFLPEELPPILISCHVVLDAELHANVAGVCHELLQVVDEPLARLLPTSRRDGAETEPVPGRPHWIRCEPRMYRVKPASQSGRQIERLADKSHASTSRLLLRRGQVQHEFLRRWRKVVMQQIAAVVLSQPLLIERTRLDPSAQLDVPNPHLL